MSATVEAVAYPGVIAELLAYPMNSLASQITALHFEAIARRRAVSIRGLNWSALPLNIRPLQRLTVVCRSLSSFEVNAM